MNDTLLRRMYLLSNKPEMVPLANEFWEEVVEPILLDAASKNKTDVTIDIKDSKINQKLSDILYNEVVLNDFLDVLIKIAKDNAIQVEYSYIKMPYGELYPIKMWLKWSCVMFYTE